LLDKDLLRSTGTDIFAFRHILIREVAYQTLTRSERGRLHAAAAAWLEGLAGEREDALSELIAYHYREAALVATAQRRGENETERIRRKAVDWLSRAADVAAAAAASQEGSRHLRGAIELAEETRLPDLYQRLGEISISGEFVVEAYQTALRLCREQNRPPLQQLQILASLLSQYMRFQGSVANRPSEAAMADLRRDARTVAQAVTDERTIAFYRAADAFFPFWISGTDRQPTTEELADSNRSASQALDAAQRLDDPNLQSMALDALAGTGQIQDNWRKSRDYSRQRLAFADRLTLTEKIDALSMVTWSSVLLGDLDEAERVSAQGLIQVQPGQVPAWVLHLVSWRIYTLTLLGRWDEALTMAERARQLWIESGQPSSGYALRGFMSAIDIARARQDERLLEVYGTVSDEIAVQFAVGTRVRRWLGYAGSDLAVIEEALRLDPVDRSVQLECLERGLSCLLDHDRLPPIDLAERVLAFQPGDFPILQAQAERVLGQSQHSVGRLSRALDLLQRAGAVPYAARVRCERALLTGDHDEMDAGLAVLERLGDTHQLGRFERLQVG
jgi:hypothetical protein